MKNILPLLVCLATSMLYAQEKVGINTNTPTRTLDVNGNMRVTQQEIKVSGTFNDVLIANQDGNVDKRSKGSLLLGEETQVETIRNIYYSNSGSDIEKSVQCARFEVTLSNNNIAMIRLRQPITSNRTISYGLRRLERRTKISGGLENTGDGDYNDSKRSVTFTSDNWNTYQAIYNIQMINNDSYRLHVVDSDTGDFYKIDFSRVISVPADWTDATIRNDKSSGLRAIICERYFNINN